jgi:hypothetical protein
MPYKDKERDKACQKAYKKAHSVELREWNRVWASEKRKNDPNFRNRELAASRKYKDANKDVCNSKSRKYRKDNLMYFREEHLKRLYGITCADYDRMLLEQNGVCAICGTTEPGHKKNYFCVDHCHATGKVRKLLCSACNVGLSRFKDNPELLRKAALYLEG